MDRSNAKSREEKKSLKGHGVGFGRVVLVGGTALAVAALLGAFVARRYKVKGVIKALEVWFKESRKINDQCQGSHESTSSAANLASSSHSSSGTSSMSTTQDEEDDDLYTEALNDNDNYDSSSDVEIWPAESLNDNYNYDCSSDVEIRPAELINDTSPEIEVEVEAKEEFNCPDLP